MQECRAEDPPDFLGSEREEDKIERAVIHEVQIEGWIVSARAYDDRRGWLTRRKAMKKLLKALIGKAGLAKDNVRRLRTQILPSLAYG